MNQNTLHCETLFSNKETGETVVVKKGFPTDISKLGTHLDNPTESELFNAVAKAFHSVYPVIYIHNQICYNTIKR